MGRLMNLVTPLHTATKRDYAARKVDQKVQCMRKAKEHEADYWDGDNHGLAELERVGKQGYVMLESYRNEQALFNLQCWALTAESFFDTDEWIWLYRHFGYSGDYEFIFFE